MESPESFFGANPKTEVIMFVSLTVNLCVLLHVFSPTVCSCIARRVFKHKGEHFTRIEEDVPGICGRICTSAPFLLAFPIGGFVLLATSDVVLDPFFAFTSAMRIAFSIAIGHYVYKCGEIIYWRKEVHYRPLLVHHLVTMALFIVITIYEQNAILGITAFFLKAHLVFAEFDNEKISRMTKTKMRRSSKVGRATAIAAFLGAVVINGLVPVCLLCAAVVTSSHRLLKMEYVPLAFFFMCLVFFFAVAAWFFNDAIHGLKGALMPKHLISVLRDFKARPLTTVINHNGLEKLCETANGTSVLHITCNDLWDRDLSQLCSGSPVKDDKINNTNIVDIRCETQAVLKNTNIL